MLDTQSSCPGLHCMFPYKFVEFGKVHMYISLLAGSLLYFNNQSRTVHSGCALSFNWAKYITICQITKNVRSAKCLAVYCMYASGASSINCIGSFSSELKGMYILSLLSLLSPHTQTCSTLKRWTSGPDASPSRSWPLAPSSSWPQRVLRRGSNGCRDWRTSSSDPPNLRLSVSGWIDD